MVSELRNGTEERGGDSGSGYFSSRGTDGRASLGGGGRSASKQSLLDLVGNRLGVSGGLSSLTVSNFHLLSRD